MKFVEIKTGCDWPGCVNVSGSEDEFDELELGLSSTRRVIDLCDEHREKLHQLLDEMLASGRPVAAETPKKKKHSYPRLNCTYPGCDSVSSRVGLAQHIRSRHGATDTAEFEQEWGTFTPANERKT
jgi:hypothetical protein